MHDEKKAVFTPRDTTLRTIQVLAEGDNPEKVTLEVFQRGGIDDRELLRRYCLKGDAFVITFSMNSRDSFDSIKKFMNAVVEVKNRPCPIALVGMQKKGLLEVTADEATNRAAELGLSHFHVQCQNYAQVMGPFGYLARRHIQARGKRTRLSKTIAWYCQSLWGSGDFWVWISSCFGIHQFHVERFEDTNASEATVYDLGGQPFTDSKHHRRSSSASDYWTIVTTDKQTHRHYHLLENPEDQAVLQHFRQQVPWSVLCPPDRCSSEEFLQLAQTWPPEHPYKKDSPALWDTVRDTFKDELQRTISNFPAHQSQCDKCQTKVCPDLYRLMYMLLQDQIGSSIRVRLDDHDLVSATGKTISTFQLAEVQSQKSLILLFLKTQTNKRSFEIEWDDVWRLHTFGIEVPVPFEISDILPLWFGSFI